MNRHRKRPAGDSTLNTLITNLMALPSGHFWPITDCDQARSGIAISDTAHLYLQAIHERMRKPGGYEVAVAAIAKALRPGHCM